MSQELFIRGLFAGLLGLVLAWGVVSRDNRETGSEYAEDRRQRFLPFIHGGLLPLFILVITVLGVLIYGVAVTAQLTISLCFSIFLHISVYYGALLLILPFLRKTVSARACALLWMIPNYLYLTSQRFMALPRPSLVIHAPGNTGWIGFFVWLAGFALVLLYKITEHFLFRHRVLKDAIPVTDPAVLAVWNEVIADIHVPKPKFHLLRAPNVTVPLSVGLFPRATKVLLPVGDYSVEELTLIFRHEIIHIARQDSWSKFFLMFCTAVCWFNPLMWIAMRKSAEDMELSCDESVLLDADTPTRKTYASLLLDTVSDGRGFTTCLCASARAMRYRLKNIMKAVPRRSGALAVGAVFFFLCVTTGYTALAYDDQSGAQRIYAGADPGQCTFSTVIVSESAGTRYLQYTISDEAAFHAYLSGLTLSTLTGNYTFSEYDTNFHVSMGTPQGQILLDVYDNVLEITDLRPESTTTSAYYIPGGIDLEYLSTIMSPHPALDLRLNRAGDPCEEIFPARLDMLWKTANGNRLIVFAPHYAEEANTLLCYPPFEKAALSFSQALAAPCTVQIETWDRSESHTVVLESMTAPILPELPSYSAHFTVYASFYGQDGTVYDAEFHFDIDTTPL